MINNDTLFTHFRSARARGYRSGWQAPAVRTVPRMPVRPDDVPPRERVTETDVWHPERDYAECGECGEVDHAGMLVDGLCWRCERQAWAEWQETLAAIAREEAARR